MIARFDRAAHVQPTDGRGFPITFELDAKGNVLKTTDTLTNFEEFTYDAQGQRETFEDKNGNVTEFFFVSVQREGKVALGNS